MLILVDVLYSSIRSLKPKIVLNMCYIVILTICKDINFVSTNSQRHLNRSKGNLIVNEPMNIKVQLSFYGSVQLLTMY